MLPKFQLTLFMFILVGAIKYSLVNGGGIKILTAHRIRDSVLIIEQQNNDH